MENKPKKTKAFIIAFIIMLVLLIVGYFLFRNGGSFLTKGITGKTFAPLLGTSQQKAVTSINGGSTSNGTQIGNGTTNNGTQTGNGTANNGANGTGINGIGTNGGRSGILGGIIPSYIPGLSSFPTPSFGSNSPSVTLTASPSSLPANGGTTQLTVATSNTTSCTPSWTNTPNSIANYTTGDLSVTRTTTFTIACTDGKTTVSASTTIVVGGTQGTIQVSLTANPALLPANGGSTTLSWTSSGGNTSTVCTRSWIKGNGKANNTAGEKVSITETTTFTILCTDGANSGSKQVTVVASGSGAYVTLSATPNSFLNKTGGSATLKWATYNISTPVCVADWKASITGNTDVVSVTGTKKFAISCTDSKTKEVFGAETTVTILDLGNGKWSSTERVALTASTLVLPATGGATTLTWASSAGIKSCIRSWDSAVPPALPTQVMASASETVNILKTTEFSVICNDGNDNNVIDTKLIIVGGITGPYVSLYANPMWLPYGGGNSVLSWSILNATNPTSCTGDWKTDPLSGNTDTVNGITATKKFIISCLDTVTKTRFSAETTVIVPTTNLSFYISSFFANPSSFISGGGTTTLSWDTVSGVSPVCTGDWKTGNLSGNTNTVNNITATKNFVLSCTDGGVKRQASTAVIVTGWNNITNCNDGIDNDKNGLTDSADPSCHTDWNATNSASYDPTINGETGALPPKIATCADGKDNNGNGKTDAFDPVCHTDGKVITGIGNEQITYDPKLEEITPLCVAPALEYTDEEKAQLDELTRQFYLLAPSLRSTSDLDAETSAFNNYGLIIDQAQELTGQCYAQTKSCLSIPKDGIWGDDGTYKPIYRAYDASTGVMSSDSVLPADIATPNDTNKNKWYPTSGATHTTETFKDPATNKLMGEFHKGTQFLDARVKKEDWLGQTRGGYVTMSDWEVKVDDCNTDPGKNSNYSGPTARKKNPYFPVNDTVDTNQSPSYLTNTGADIAGMDTATKITTAILTLGTYTYDVSRWAGLTLQDPSGSGSNFDMISWLDDLNCNRYCVAKSLTIAAEAISKIDPKTGDLLIKNAKDIASNPISQWRGSDVPPHLQSTEWPNLDAVTKAIRTIGSVCVADIKAVCGLTPMSATFVPSLTYDDPRVKSQNWYEPLQYALFKEGDTYGGGSTRRFQPDVTAIQNASKSITKMGQAFGKEVNFSSFEQEFMVW